MGTFPSSPSLILRGMHRVNRYLADTLFMLVGTAGLVAVAVGLWLIFVPSARPVFGL